MLTRAIIAAFVLLFISSAVAEEQLGVAVYPGAKYDDIRTMRLRENPAMHGAAYRTSDDIAKVTAFYREQGLLLLKIGSPSNERARFKQVKSNVDVVLQQPWKDAQTGATMKDTLILIIKEEAK